MLLERLEELVDRIRDEPPEMRSKARAHLLDSLVLMVAARDHPLTRQAARAGTPPGGGGQAAFTAAVACDALGLDDFDELTRTHPGAVVVAALIGDCLESSRPVSGRALLGGLVAGYEVTCRFGEIAGASSLHDRGFHPSSVCGVLGAAAGLAVVRGRPASAAVGLAASLASGVFELDGRGAVKGLQAGWAASGAIVANRFVEAGYAPAPSVLDGPRGLLRALGGSGGEDAVSAALGGPLRIERVSFKPYSHFTDLHAATAALFALLRDEDIDVAGIARIEAHLASGAGARMSREFPPRAPRLARRCPEFALAAAACRGVASSVPDPLLDAFGEAALGDPRILALGEKVRWLDDIEPGGVAAAVVTVATVDGRRFTASAGGYPGDGRSEEHRWGWPEIAERSTSLLPDDAGDLIGSVDAIEAAVDVRPIAQRIAAHLRL